LDGFVIEEGVVPAALASGVQIMVETTPGKIFPQKWGLAQKFRHFLSSQRGWMFGPYSSWGGEDTDLSYYEPR